MPGTEQLTPEPESGQKDIDIVREHSTEFGPRAVEMMREIHQNPELGAREFDTTERIAGHITETFPDSDFLEIVNGFWEVKEKGQSEVLGRTGIIVKLKGDHPGPTIMLRAEIDALPLPEKTDLDYSSDTEGIMHACGHDFHTAMLFQSLCTLAKTREERGIAGNVVFLFQPNEEAIIDDRQGAIPAIQSLNSTHSEGSDKSWGEEIDAAVALHCDPRSTIGTVDYAHGVFLAASAAIEIELNSPGGHIAFPDSPNIVDISGKITQKITAEFNREGARANVVVEPTYNTTEGRQTFSTLPTLQKVGCGIRIMSADAGGIRREIADRIEEIVTEAISEDRNSSEVGYHLRNIPGTRPVINDPALTDLTLGAAEDVFGDSFQGNEGMLPAAEDFSYYRDGLGGTLGVPGAPRLPISDIAIGTASREYPPSGAHTSELKIDPEIIGKGADLFSLTALRFLSKGEEYWKNLREQSNTVA